MNFVYKKGCLKPLSAQEIAVAANAASPFAPFTEGDFIGENSRINRLTCNCNGNGEFEVLPPRANEFRLRVCCRQCAKEMFL